MRSIGVARLGAIKPHPSAHALAYVKQSQLLINHVAGASTYTSPSFTSSASGSTFVIFSYTTNALASVPTDSYGNTYTLLSTQAGSGYATAAIYACANGIGGAGHTFNAPYTTADGGDVLFFLEVGNCIAVDTGSIVSQNVSSYPTANQPLTVTSNTLAQAGSLMLVFLGGGGTSDGAYWTINSPYTKVIEEPDANTYWGAAIASHYVTSTAPDSCTATSTIAGDMDQSQIIIAFKSKTP